MSGRICIAQVRGLRLIQESYGVPFVGCVRPGDAVVLMYPDFVRDKGHDLPGLTTGSEFCIRIATRHPLPVQGDGEIIGETPVVVAVVPRAVDVIVPFAATAAAPSPTRSNS